MNHHLSLVVLALVLVATVNAADKNAAVDVADKNPKIMRRGAQVKQKNRRTSERKRNLKKGKK
jgi:hypothetical protein